MTLLLELFILFQIPILDLDVQSDVVGLDLVGNHGILGSDSYINYTFKRISNIIS